MSRQSVINFILVAFGLCGYGIEAEAQKTVVIHAGQLFDGKSDRLLTNQWIVIQGDRITEVGPAGSVKTPVGAEEIDLGKATVLPGLIDGHAHLFKSNKLGGGSAFTVQMLLTDSWQYRTIVAVVNARKNLEAGFTTMRDCGTVGAMYSDTDLRRAINEGLVPGPRLQVATIPLIGTTWLPPSRGPQRSFSPEVTVPSGARAVDSPWEGRKAVRDNFKYGADFIKVFPGGSPSHFEPDGNLWVPATMTLEEDKAIVDEAHRQGIKAACHAFGGVPLRDSIEAGCDSIEMADDVDPESISKMSNKGIFLVMALSQVKNSEASELQATDGKYSRAAMQKVTLQRALKAGVKVAFGPNAGDSGPEHGTQAKDVEYMVDYGMKPVQVLHAATSVAAELMGWQDRVGTIEKGKYADLIAVAGNPVADITELERVKFVMKGGQIVRNDLK
jgi:imidazolonepropionase-like amidohydrolase